MRTVYSYAPPMIHRVVCKKVSKLTIDAKEELLIELI